MVHCLVATDYLLGPLGPAGMAAALKNNIILFNTPNISLETVCCRHGDLCCVCLEATSA
jgi:hypothetical protein